MVSKQIRPDRITREEINEAMERFLAKGGKIQKIETPQKVSNSLLDTFDLQDSFTGDDFSYLDLRIHN